MIQRAVQGVRDFFDGTLERLTICQECGGVRYVEILTRAGEVLEVPCPQCNNGSTMELAE